MRGPSSGETLRRLRRHIAERWPESPGKDVVLQVLDEMVWELHRTKAEAE
jgi:hypothetical protein